jgi:tetratricopeptide (TPR) repeat protein
VTRSLVLAAVLVATSAQANVWDDAVGQGKPERAAQEAYDAAMRQGDEHALQASASNVSYRMVKMQLQLAVEAYQAAAAARPTAAEPYYRIGTLLHSFYFDCTDVPRTLVSPLCNPNSFNRERARQVIEAWDAFEARAPLDPRLSVGAFGENEILFERAILHTKLATKKDLEAAASDYEKMLARHDGSDAAERVLGNLAETYMMVGRMEDALETYRQAVRAGSDTSTWYGYAVALDRDESTRQALDIIRSLGRDQRDAFSSAVRGGGTFFVPEGEKYYYFALVDEALGSFDDAIEEWKLFIASRAHPQFQPRAKAHLDALLKKRKDKPPASTPLPWPLPID